MQTKFFWILPFLLLLSACSAHPGSGGWGATSADAAFSRLEVRYNGHADFYIKNNDKDAAWRCFWGAIDKQTLGLQCVQAANNKTEEKYLFVVDEARQEAVLKLGDKVIGNYAWQAPPKP